MTDFDLLVVGGGAAGLAAARAANPRKRRVAMVQDGPVGGDCTFTGCVPSKTLIESGAAGLDFAAAIGRVRDAVSRIAATETADVLRGEGIEVIEGRAEFVAADAVRVAGRTLRSPRVVVATGSAPARPDIPGLDHPDVLDSESFWGLTERPDSLVVLGGGPVGCELAQAMGRFGVDVTLVEQGHRLLSKEDPAASEVLAAVFAERGIEVRLGAQVTRVEVGDGRVTIELDGGTLAADRLVVATGRTPRTGGLGLERAGVRLEPDGSVRVGDTMATSANGVWAVGDVTGRLLFTHAADEMGRTAALNAVYRPLHLSVHEAAIPRVTFTDPEIAQVGLTEAQAAREHPGAVVAELPMSAVDRAIAAGRTEGFVKLIARPRLKVGALGKLVGATVVCPHAGEVIHELALAVRTGTAVGRLAQTVHAYPTWSTAVRSAAAQFLFEVDGRSARPARGG